MIDQNEGTWEKDQCAHFMRSREENGQLSNLTSRYELEVNGTVFQGPQGLYQAMKFPGLPTLQRQIAWQSSGIEATKMAESHDDRAREDWTEVRVEALAYAIATKLLQHPRRFGMALNATGEKPVVYVSYRDRWEGATPKENTLYGVNALGKLLSKLRDERTRCKRPVRGQKLNPVQEFLRDTDLGRLRVMGKPLPELGAS